jgi:hypothetical protein
VTLLAETCAVLAAHGVPHAIVGAAALAAHGVTRASADVDLLVVDPRCLDPGIWAPLTARGHTVDVRCGDAADPLAGVVRVASRTDVPVDVVVGRAAWQDAIVRRAVPAAVADVTVPIVRAPDLVLLKLYAGGSQDAWDVDQLLDAVPGLEADVEASLAALPPECTALWRRVTSARRA